MKAVEYRNIRMDYGDTVIIKDFNLSVLRGEFVTIIGSSGCGKTTILKSVVPWIRFVRRDGWEEFSTKINYIKMCKCT